MMRCLLLLIGLSILTNDWTAADETEASSRFSKLATKIASSYEIQSGDQTLKLRSEPVLTWTNPEVGEIYGAVFIWTDDKRPAVIASIFKWYAPFTHRTHEFQSLVTDPIRATRDGKTDWQTEQPGITWKPVPGNPSTGTTAAQAFTRMRFVAKRFEVELTDKDGSVETLRLLSQPLYRYQNPENGIEEGALFAFARATDPEALLLLEVRRENGVDKLYYALARSNFLPLKATFEGAEVWTKGRLLRRDSYSGKGAYAKVQFDD
ncbi:hypothetical protein LOC67_14810 [Stieleria sp. JC731]|uniref:hypothetical protein n=1 Tax=Pirellulaceae TaxID=2691357 RepID=UPI001E577EDA|nr:hypothetical protein [Stieleria sp. JC731]MCC9601829.1 hypothetical protein [Stieleria sp. JC731]